MNVEIFYFLIVNGKEVIKRLNAENWIYSHARGSHHYYKKNGCMIVVPVHGAKDLATGTLHSIFRQAGWKK
jgi:predicted RNA binding protein YcfA (HicA-like mRNA interferase family)